MLKRSFFFTFLVLLLAVSATAQSFGDTKSWKVPGAFLKHVSGDDDGDNIYVVSGTTASATMPGGDLFIVNKRTGQTSRIFVSSLPTLAVLVDNTGSSKAIYTVSNDGLLRVFDYKTHALLRQIPVSNYGGDQITLTQTYNNIFISVSRGQGNHALVWGRYLFVAHFNRGDNVVMLDKNFRTVREFGFGPNSADFVGNRVMIYDTYTGSSIGSLPYPKNRLLVDSVPAMSVDGAYLTMTTPGPWGNWVRVYTVSPWGGVYGPWDVSVDFANCSTISGRWLFAGTESGLLHAVDMFDVFWNASKAKPMATVNLIAATGSTQNAIEVRGIKADDRQVAWWSSGGDPFFVGRWPTVGTVSFSERRR